MSKPKKAVEVWILHINGGPFNTDWFASRKAAVAATSRWGLIYGCVVQAVRYVPKVKP